MPIDTLTALKSATPVFWKNPHHATFSVASHDIDLDINDINDAEQRLQRFAPFIATVFPETTTQQGIIESPVYQLSKMSEQFDLAKDKLLLKADNDLPISGSIKARGGIYEVLYHAEQLALNHGHVTTADDYRIFASNEMYQFFSQFEIAVGSTGNLGLSIGIMSAKLGFQTSVHMSRDAKEWKKETLRSNGVTVHEYEGDYGEAITKGRALAENNPKCHFVDDENSQELFLGYAVAGVRLKNQLSKLNITINAEKPLCVYLPCGVGGGPGGVAFGLKVAFGDNVHCIFAEPAQSPCMLLGIYTGLHDEISVNDIGLNNSTAADGLAVGRASGFVGRTMQRSIEALYTVTDQQLYNFLASAHSLENLKLEPSACAGFAGLEHTKYIKNATHLIWATGGSMVPESVFKDYLSLSS